MLPISRKALLVVLGTASWAMGAPVLSTVPAGVDLQAIRGFLRAQDRDDRSDPSARFWASALPGTKLILVYVRSQGDCGTGGCTLLVLRPNGASLRVESWFPATLLPVTLLTSEHLGRPDIGIGCRCEPTKDGGWAFYQIPLRFNGWRYRRVINVHLANEGQQARGRILISGREAGIALGQERRDPR